MSDIKSSNKFIATPMEIAYPILEMASGYDIALGGGPAALIGSRIKASIKLTACKLANLPYLMQTYQSESIM